MFQHIVMIEIILFIFQFINVLYFLKEIHFVDKVDNDCFENLDKVKRMLVIEFEDYDIPKKINALSIVDEIKLSDMVNDLDHMLERTDSLRSVIFQLIGVKHLVDEYKKQEDKQ